MGLETDYDRNIGDRLQQAASLALMQSKFEKQVLWPYTMQAIKACGHSDKLSITDPFNLDPSHKKEPFKPTKNKPNEVLDSLFFNWLDRGNSGGRK
jgi:hypothetical protein